MKKAIKTNKIAPYLYIAPFVILTLFIFGYSIPSIFIFSFQRIRGISGEFIGLGNYKHVITNIEFQAAVKNNFQLLIIVPVLVFIAIIIAVLVFEGVKGWRFYRTAIFIPYILPITVVGITFGYIFTLRGVLNEYLKILNMDFEIDWLGNPNLALWTLMIIIIWKELGFGIMLFLARLMSINEDLYDAAKIDGANWFGLLFHITIPQLATLIEFFTIITIINILSWIFAYSYTVTMGGPGNATMVIELFIFRQLMKWSIPKVGAGAAASVLLFFVVIILVFSLLRLRKGMIYEIE
jgi:ABC-type sugar transport system permease subunit